MRVLVTGAGSGVGAELCRQILAYQPEQVVLFDRFEQALRVTADELAHSGADVVAAPGDVTDARRLEQAVRLHKPQIVVHTGAHNDAKALKEDPCEAVRSNVIGTRRLVDVCRAYDVKRLVVLSSTEVANPTTPLAATRQLSERLVRSLTSDGTLATSVVRLGSILGKPGSVVPKLREQIRAGGPVRVSHPEVRRYFMLISEAVTLTLHAAAEGEAGAVHVLDMGEPLRIVELARNLIRLEGMVPDTEVPIEFTGLPYGERLLDVMAAPDEIIAPSQVRGLLRVRRTGAEDASFAAKVETLAAAAERRDQRAAVEILTQLVPITESKEDQPSHASFGLELDETDAAAAVLESVDASLQDCRSCGQRTATRSRARSTTERVRRAMSTERLFRCTSCGWRGWMPVLEQGALIAPPVPRTAPELDDLDIAMAKGETENVPSKALD